MKRINLLLTLAIPVLLMQHVQAQSVAEKATSTTTISNLVGITNRFNTGSTFLIADSTVLDYCTNNCGRGGDLNHQLKYDFSEKWGYNTFSSFYYPEFKYLQTFDTLNNLTNYITIISDTATGDKNSTQTVYFYFPSSNLVKEKVQQNWVGTTSWNNISANYYTYASGKLQIDLLVDWSNLTGTFSDTISQIIYTYDPITGNVVNEVFYNYNNILHNFVFSTQYTFTYNSSNKVSTKLFSTFGTSSFVNTNRHTYLYDTITSSGNLLSDQYEFYNTATNVWVDSTLNVYANFSHVNCPDTSFFYVYDSTAKVWLSTTKYSYQYNSFSTPQLIKKTAESYNTGGGFWEFAYGDTMTNYYYNLVTVNGIKQITTNGMEVAIFPVPAENTLHININNLIATTMDISIIDVAGRTVKQWNVVNILDYTTEIPVSNLVAGVYFVQIKTAQGQINKQIVINH